MLNEKAKEIRKLTVKTIGGLGVGHIGGAVSICEVLAALYFDVMNVDPENPKMENRDRFVLSKGHAGPAVYATLALKGFLKEEELDTLNRPGTHLPSHCDMRLTNGVDMTTGSLGQGFSAAVGMALAAQADKRDLNVYTIIGDGESQEGQIWEAALLAGDRKLDNLIAFTDYRSWKRCYNLEGWGQSCLGAWCSLRKMPVLQIWKIQSLPGCTFPGSSETAYKRCFKKLFRIPG